MDVLVTPAEDGAAWTMTDLLGRSMGQIAGSGPSFTIHPDGQARETMSGMKKGPFASLDDAMAEIEKHTRGTCRRVSGQDGR